MLPPGAAVAGVTLLVGASLFALPPTAEAPLPRQVGAAAAAMVVWSYCDGFVGRGDWGMAALEGLLLTNVALHWTALLLEAFGAHQTRFSLTVMTQNRVWRLLDRRFTP